MKPRMRTTKAGFQNQQEVKMNTDSLVNKIKIKSKELQALIRYRGVENIRFYASITTLNVETPIDSIANTIGVREIVECQIDESLYQVKDWYKITLIPIKDSGKYGYEHYYMTNFVSLINDGLITIKDMN